MGSGSIELLEVRHPCMELQDSSNFIPNDAVFHKGMQNFAFLLLFFLLFIYIVYFLVIRWAQVLHYYRTKYGRQKV